MRPGHARRACDQSKFIEEMMTDTAMKDRIRKHILAEFLPGEPEENLTADVGLVSEGIIDSMASLKLVSYLEEEFGVIIPAHQIDAEHLDTVDLIAATVVSNIPQS
jgi:acyl carrier protein